MNQKLIKQGFVIAGLMNFSVLVFSRGFTNEAINTADPVVMSNFGLLIIVLWGLAYIAAAKVDISNIKWLAAVFAVEKLVYGLVWIIWQLNNSLSDLYATDAFAGIFYTIYGFNDLMFMLFFAYVFVAAFKNQAK